MKLEIRTSGMETQVLEIDAVSDEEVGNRIGLPRASSEEIDYLVEDEPFLDEWLEACKEARLRQEAAMVAGRQ